MARRSGRPSHAEREMPISYAIDHARHRMDSVAVGPIAYADILDHLAAEGHGGGLPYRELIDASDAELTLTPAEVRRLVDELRRLGREGTLGPTAVLVGSEFNYGLLRMLETLLEDVTPLRPFRDRDEAERWLAAA